MKYKSPKRKKPRKERGTWLQDCGKFLAGLAALLKVVFDFVVWLSTR
jgi:hypothetical protein